MLYFMTAKELCLSATSHLTLSWNLVFFMQAGEDLDTPYSLKRSEEVVLDHNAFVEARVHDGVLEVFWFKHGWHASFVMVELISAKHIAQVPWTNERPLENRELNAIIGAWFTLWRD
ncbi:diacylglycerol kinase 4-like protein [Tanacetum coccineum]